MKKNRILLLLVALFVLTGSLSVQAASTVSQYLTTYTGDEFYGETIPTSGSYGTIATNAATGTMTVEEETDSNKAYLYTGGSEYKKESLVIYTYSKTASERKPLENLVQKMTARVKISSSTAQVHLFTLSKAWNLQTTTDTGGVVLKNGGAYYYSMDDGAYVNFVSDGTLPLDTWCTVEVIYDFTGTGNYMTASVFDASGAVVATVPMTYVSSFSRYSSKVPHLRTLINFENVPQDETVHVDDIALYGIENYEAAACSDVAYDEEKRVVTFTFDSDVDNSLVSKSNVGIVADNPALDVTGRYKTTIEGKTISVDVSDLPYAETFTVKLSGTGISEEKAIEVTTPADPFENALLGVTFASETGTDIAAGDKVVATASIENMSNVDKKFMLLVTSWNSKDECVAIRNVVGVIEVGKELPIDLPAVELEDEGSSLRVSLIDNWNTMSPIGDVAVYELGGE